MPRYYLDLYHGDGLTVDEEGQVFETRARLRREAMRILPDVLRDEMFDGDRARIMVKVRDESGRAVFEASLTLDSAWND
ncbi:DUF6894 family protein [Mesorhizobium shangrilense]|uniref:DUF6894 domain-containing protein n=1 Tax=Mesorhizobium shangrilense TaxID=460060 RepID=A0ABV2D7B8_9HYPH